MSLETHIICFLALTCVIFCATGHSAAGLVDIDYEGKSGGGAALSNRLSSIVKKQTQNFEIWDQYMYCNEIDNSFIHTGQPRFFVSGRKVSGSSTLLTWQGLAVPLVDTDDWGPGIPEDCAAIEQGTADTIDLHCFWSPEKFICQY